MKYTLRQLEVFLAIAHYENVSRAANALSMSQSACSGALKELENQFDIQLFDRVGKRLQTNDTGHQLRPRAEALMAHAADVENELIEHDRSSLLKVGATLTIGNYLCVPLIRRYTEEQHNGKVRLEVANTTSITQKLLNFDIDVGMIEGEINHPDLSTIPWMEDELICFCSPEHVLASTAEARNERLVEQAWILREPGSGTRQIFDRGMGELLPQLTITLELEHNEAIKQAVKSNMGISCLSEIALKDALAQKTLLPIQTPELDFTRRLYVVIHKDKYQSAGIQHWLELCGRPRF